MFIQWNERGITHHFVIYLHIWGEVFIKKYTQLYYLITYQKTTDWISMLSYALHSQCNWPIKWVYVLKSDAFIVILSLSLSFSLSLSLSLSLCVCVCTHLDYWMLKNSSSFGSLTLVLHPHISLNDSPLIIIIIV